MDEEAAEGGGAGKALHGAGVGNEDDVVLIVAAHGHAFGGEQADDGERGAFDADDFADGIAIAEEGGGGGFADETDFIGVADIDIGEVFAAGELPGTDGDVVLADAGDLDGLVLVTEGDLGVGANLGTGTGDAGSFAANGIEITLSEGAGAAEAHAEAATVDAAGEDDEDILAEGGDAGFDLGFRAVANAGGGDDR